MVSDPVIIKKVGHKKIYLHQSHKLPKYRKLFPFYDQALPRICQAVKKIDDHLTLIDVGANVGDSVALITDKVSGNFLCIEGDKKYLPVLKKNVAKFKSSTIEIEPSYCGDDTKNTLSIINENGTARLIETNNSKIKNIKTLDQIINEHPKFKSANILKIDTDGFEINTLKGAGKFITSSRPIIYTEFTPELYDQLGQKYSELIELLIKYGYTHSLFYDNFGRPVKKINLNDQKSISLLVSKIDKKNIYYYDVLAVPDKLYSKYEKLFEEELLSHISKLDKLYETKKIVLDNADKELTNLSSIVKTKDKELTNLSSIVKTKDKELTNLSSIVKTKDKELTNLSSIVKTKNKELDNYINKNQTITFERNDFENRLRKIYESKGWRILQRLYLIKDKMVSISTIINNNFAKIKNILNPPKPHKRKINLKSKKVVFVDHSFHQKTKSTVFIIDILKKYFDVEIIWDESWQGKPFPDLSFVDESYVGIVFFQNMPSLDIYNSINNNNKVFIPMFDGSSGEPDDYWLRYSELKIINFSKTLHNKVLKIGCDSLFVQRFPEPEKFAPGNPKKAFFYYRVNSINFDIVKKLIGKYVNKIHIHKTIDPGYTFEKPSKSDTNKYRITYSTWFEKKSDQWKAAEPYGIFIAPRPSEGIGQGFIEAMARGKAVIAPNNPTMNEYIVHGENGYLYDLNNPQPIDFSKIKQVQKNAHQYIKEGWKNRNKEVVKIKKYLLEN